MGAFCGFTVAPLHRVAMLILKLEFGVWSLEFGSRRSENRVHHSSVRHLFVWAALSEVKGVKVREIERGSE